MNWSGGSLRRHARPRHPTPAQRQREHFLTAAARGSSSAPASTRMPWDDFVPSFLAGRNPPAEQARDGFSEVDVAPSRPLPRKSATMFRKDHEEDLRMSNASTGAAADELVGKEERGDGASTNVGRIDTAAAFESARVDLLAQDDWAGLRAARPVRPTRTSQSVRRASSRLDRPVSSRIHRDATSRVASDKKKDGQRGEGLAGGGDGGWAVKRSWAAVMREEDQEEDRSDGAQRGKQKRTTSPLKQRRAFPEPEPFDPFKWPFMSGALLPIDHYEDDDDDGNGITVTIARHPIHEETLDSLPSISHISPINNCRYRADISPPGPSKALLQIDLTHIPTSSSSSADDLSPSDLKDSHYTQNGPKDQGHQRYSQIGLSGAGTRREQELKHPPFRNSQPDDVSHGRKHACHRPQHTQHQSLDRNRLTTHTHDDYEPHPSHKDRRSQQGAAPTPPIAAPPRPPPPSGHAAASLASSPSGRRSRETRSLADKDDGITYENRHGVDDDGGVRSSSVAPGPRRDSCADMGADTDTGAAARGSDMHQQRDNKQRERREEREQAGTGSQQEERRGPLHARHARRARQASDIPSHEACAQFPRASSRASAAASRPAAEKIKSGRAIDADASSFTEGSSGTVSNGRIGVIVSSDAGMSTHRAPEPVPNTRARIGGESRPANDDRRSGASSGSRDDQNKGAGDEDEDAAWKRFVLGPSSSSSAPSMLAHAPRSAYPEHPTAAAGDETRRSACDGDGEAGAGARRAIGPAVCDGRRGGVRGGAADLRRHRDGCGGVGDDGAGRAASPGSQAPRQGRREHAATRTHAEPEVGGGRAGSGERPTRARGPASAVVPPTSAAAPCFAEVAAALARGPEAVPAGWTLRERVPRVEASSSSRGGTSNGSRDGRAPAVPAARRASKAARRRSPTRLRAVAPPPVPAASVVARAATAPAPVPATGKPASGRGERAKKGCGGSGGWFGQERSIFDFPVSSSEDEARDRDG